MDDECQDNYHRSIICVTNAVHDHEDDEKDDDGDDKDDECDDNYHRRILCINGASEEMMMIRMMTVMIRMMIPIIVASPALPLLPHQRR